MNMCVSSVRMLSQTKDKLIQREDNGHLTDSTRTHTFTSTSAGGFWEIKP